MTSENHSPFPSSWKPRYGVPECLDLLGISRKHFYGQVKAKRYRIIKDGRRTFMTHEQLLDAAAGDGRKTTAIQKRLDSPG